MAKAWDVAGYTYRAANYCPSCIVAQLPTGPGEAFDGWALAPGVQMSTEENLTEIAFAFGIDRMDGRTFDSWDFPKVLFSFQVEDAEYCDSCGEEL